MLPEMNPDIGPVEMQQDMSDISNRHLEEMFSRNMNLSDGHAGEANGLSHTIESVEQPPPSIKYNMSQHYTHSAHVVRGLHPLQPSTEETATRLLIKNGIAPSSLLRAQLTLFEQADPDQRARLLELWTIVPPTYARNGGQDLADRLGEYQTTSLVQEQELALLRYQKSGIGVDGQNGVQVQQMVDRKPPPVGFFQQSSGEGIKDAIEQYSSAVPGQSLDCNGNLSEDLKKQQMELQYGSFDQTQHHNGEMPEIEMEDEEML